MISIGIVGTGIAGLQLGLLLQQRGIPATIYADRTPEQQRGGRILNNVVRFGHTRERERALGVNHWESVGPDLTSVSLAVGGEHPLGFVGHLSQPASYVDMRLYQATLLEDFAARGGDVVFGTVQAEDLERLSMHHDLIVVASGRGSLAELFPRIAAFSPGFVISAEPHGHPRFFVSHGMSDQILPIDQCSRVIVPKLRSMGFDVTFREFEGRHEMPPDIAADGLKWVAAP